MASTIANVYTAEPVASGALRRAPLGTAMLGQRVGRTFKVRLPRGTTEFRVSAIEYQPEAAGDFDR